MTPLRTLCIVALTVIAVVLPSAAQEPMACWWRTSVAAVHVGQPFEVVLTCAVMETSAAVVVPDESRLDAAVVQMAPFEVLGGRHPSDLRDGDRRFFQYAYTVRFLSDDEFGQDVPLPTLEIPFRIDTRKDGESIPGRSRSYQMPAQSIRVLSLVPANAADIRDAGQQEFGDVGERLFRARVWTAVAGVLMTLAAAVALSLVVTLAKRSRARGPSTARRLVGDPRILGAVHRELVDIRRTRGISGWNPTLAARALAATRIAAAYELGHAVSQTAMSNGAGLGRPGQIVLPQRVGSSKRIAVSAATTAVTVDRALAVHGASNGHGRLEPLQLALARLAAAQFGQSQTLDEDALDEALSTSAALARRLSIEHIWPLKTITALWRKPWRA